MAFRCSIQLEVDQVLFEESSPCVRKVILNRPGKLNCLTYEMIIQMLTTLKAYEHHAAVGCIIIKGNGKAFCAGGDVVGVICCSVGGHWSFAACFYRAQLILDHTIATYKKPVVTFIDGVVMGGGAGLCMQTNYRIVTENTVFAMPEASIGLFPDVGASYFLSRLPGFIGEYLALTGTRLDGSEMVACGLASHFVPSKDLSNLEKVICTQTSLTTTSISELINKFAVRPILLKEESPLSRLHIVNECFSGGSVEEILSALREEAKKEDAGQWIKKAVSSMMAASPTSLKITLKSIREGRTKNLEQCFRTEYNISCQMLKGSFGKDFYEGSRALLLDKDKRPKWKPHKLELVTDDYIKEFFREIEDPNWEPLELPLKSNL